MSTLVVLTATLLSLFRVEAERGFGRRFALGFYQQTVERYEGPNIMKEIN